MKFKPLGDNIVGRTAIVKRDGEAEQKIILLDETRVTKLIVVDALGPAAAARGIKVGDLIFSMTISMFTVRTGVRPVLKGEHVADTMFLDPGETIYVQTEDGTKYVPIDSPGAAKSLGYVESEKADESEAA